jgi:WD40 repeat protein
VSGKKPRTVGTAPVPAIDWFAAGRSVATARALLILDEKRQGERLLWRIGSDGEAKSCKLSISQQSVVYPTAASADGTVFAAGVGADYTNRITRVWDVTGNAARERASLRGDPVPTRRLVREKQPGKPPGKVRDEGPGEPRPLNVWAMALAADGRSLALADIDGTIQVWSLAEAEPRLRATLQGHKQERVMGAVQRLAFSADGQRLVTVGGDRKLVVWDIASAKAVYAASFPSTLDDAGFAPDGRHIITSNPDGTIYILRLPRNP